MLRSVITNDKLYWYRAELLSVTDGDTMKVRIDMGMRIYRDVVLRIEAINAPETKGDSRPLGLAAKDAAAKWFEGRSLAIKTYKDPGSYDRYTAEIFDINTEDSFSKYMLDGGFAVAYVYKWG